MRDIRRRIERAIETDPVIKKGLQRGIINSRALARFIQDTEGLDSTPDAILGVIRRYPLGDGESSDLSQVFRECELGLRNRVADLEVKYHQETLNRIAQFASSIRTAKGENVKLVVGVRFIRVISDQKALEGFRNTLQPGEVIRYTAELTEISVHLPPAAFATKGVVGKITMELALNDINLAGIMEGAPELILLVAEADAPRALEALQRMLKEEAADPKQSLMTSGAVTRRSPSRESRVARPTDFSI